MRKRWFLIRPQKPRTVAALCALTLAGAALSPDFLRPTFPETGLQRLALLRWAEAALPWLFSPPMWSLWYALGTAAAVGLVWLTVVRTLPSLRLPRSGLTAHLATGAAVTAAMTAGLAGQTGITEVGLLAAAALSIMAAASSTIRDFIYIDADRAAGRRTLPIRLGPRAALTVMTATVVAAYLLALFLVLHRIGMQERVLALFGLPLGAHIHVLRRLGQDPSPAGARKAAGPVAVIFWVMTVLFVAAQASL